MSDEKKIIWIAWEDDASIRSRVLAEELQADFYTFTTFEGMKYCGVLRYLVAIIQTTILIVKRKPEVVLVQNPSIFLAFWTAITRGLLNYKLVVDYHTFYINPNSLLRSVLNKVNSYALNASDLVIVTNESYKNKISDVIKTEIMILPDKIPDISTNGELPQLEGRANLLYICSFSEDEPWREVIKAASLLEDDVYIYISGKADKTIMRMPKPQNVIFTGFVPVEKYHAMLKSVDAIIVLTEAEHCLVCGGYEAVAVEKPLIISEKKAIKQFFNSGAIYTKNNASDIAAAINNAIAGAATYGTQVRELKRMRQVDWQESWRILTAHI